MVATVLTVYGIETALNLRRILKVSTLQQCLPFTVLKHQEAFASSVITDVATVLTVYGIETVSRP